MRGRLRLKSIALHYVLKGLTLFSHFANGIKGAHYYLVQMAIAHQIRVLSQRVLETGPDLAANVFFTNAQTIAKIPQSQASHSVDLLIRNR